MSNNIVVFSNNNDQINDGGIWSPSLITTEAWFDASDASTIDLREDTYVVQWDDKSGNNRYASQGTAADQPTYSSSDSLANNLPTIKGLSSTDSGFLTFNENISTREIFVVTYYKDGLDVGFDSYNYLFSGPSSPNDTPRWLGDGGGGATKSNWFTTGTRVVDQHYRDGSDSSTQVALPMPLTLWRARHSTTAGNLNRVLGSNQYKTSRNWDGGIGEVIIFSSLQDEDTIHKVEGYLAWKWGLTTSLPSAHPYKNVLP